MPAIQLKLSSDSDTMSCQTSGSFGFHYNNADIPGGRLNGRTKLVEAAWFEGLMVGTRFQASGP